MTIAPPMAERVLQRLVDTLALYFGWRAYHTHDSRRSAPGFPDVCCVRGERLVFAELKTAVGRLSEAQQGWLAALRQVPGVEVYVWRPSDWMDGAIEEVLR